MDLKFRFPDSCRDEQLNLRSQQLIVSTVEDSVLQTEMTDLLSLWKRMTPSVSSSSNPWVGWVRSSLTVEMRSGLSDVPLTLVLMETYVTLMI